MTEIYIEDFTGDKHYPAWMVSLEYGKHSVTGEMLTWDAIITRPLTDEDMYVQVGLNDGEGLHSDTSLEAKDFTETALREAMPFEGDNFNKWVAAVMTTYRNIENYRR